jgi:hypothetical protein
MKIVLIPSVNRRAMVLDVEAVGLQGEAFAYGYVVIDLATGELEEARRVGCDPARARGSSNRYAWVLENVPSYVWTESVPYGHVLDAPRVVRDDFWAAWQRLRGPRGGEVDLWADVGWPVEARFLAQCVDDGRDRERDYTGPYPLLDVSTVLSVYPYLKLADPWGDGRSGVKTASSACMRPDGKPEPFGGGILDQLTIHDPLCDAYVSARQLYHATRAEARGDRAADRVREVPLDR